MVQLVLRVHSQLNDFVALTKPRITLLVLFTTFVGMWLASQGSLSLELIFFTLLGTGLASGASGVFNHYVDRDIDPLMRRTKNRPIASGRVHPAAALFFGICLTICSASILMSMVNTIAATLAMFTIFFYIAIYSLWLKRNSVLCTEIGGVAGAIPPLIGWAAVSNEFKLEAVLLFMLLFLWQPPHFWALALLRVDEYRQVNVPMLPVVKGEAATKNRMLLYTVGLLPVSIWLCYLLEANLYLFAACLALNLVYIAKTLKFYQAKVTGKSAMGLFGYSISYIFLIFGMLFFMA